MEYKILAKILASKLDYKMRHSKPDVYYNYITRVKFIIIIFSIGFATDIESAEPLSEVCSLYRQRHETFCHLLSLFSLWC